MAVLMTTKVVKPDFVSGPDMISDLVSGSLVHPDFAILPGCVCKKTKCNISILYQGKKLLQWPASGLMRRQMCQSMPLEWVVGWTGRHIF